MFTVISNAWFDGEDVIVKTDEGIQMSLRDDDIVRTVELYHMSRLPKTENQKKIFARLIIGKAVDVSALSGVDKRSLKEAIKKGEREKMSKSTKWELKLDGVKSDEPIHKVRAKVWEIIEGLIEREGVDVGKSEVKQIVESKRDKDSGEVTIVLSLTKSFANSDKVDGIMGIIEEELMKDICSDVLESKKVE